jgi:hypothetical protein
MTRRVAAQPALLARHRGKYGAAVTAFPIVQCTRAFWRSSFAGCVHAYIPSVCKQRRATL